MRKLLTNKKSKFDQIPSPPWFINFFYRPMWITWPDCMSGKLRTSLKWQRSKWQALVRMGKENLVRPQFEFFCLFVCLSGNQLFERDFCPCCFFSHCMSCVCYVVCCLCVCAVCNICVFCTNFTLHDKHIVSTELNWKYPAEFFSKIIEIIDQSLLVYDMMVYNVMFSL